MNEVPKITGIQKIGPVRAQSSRDIPYGGCTPLPRDILLLRIGQPRGYLIYRRAVGKIRVDRRNTVVASAVDVESGSIPHAGRRGHNGVTLQDKRGVKRERLAPSKAHFVHGNTHGANYYGAIRIDEWIVQLARRNSLRGSLCQVTSIVGHLHEIARRNDSSRPIRIGRRQGDPGKRDNHGSIRRAESARIDDAVVGQAGNGARRIENIQRTGGLPGQWIAESGGSGLVHVACGIAVRNAVRSVQEVIELKPYQQRLGVVNTRAGGIAGPELAFVVIRDPHFRRCVHTHVHSENRKNRKSDQRNEDRDALLVPVRDVPACPILIL